MNRLFRFSKTWPPVWLNKATVQIIRHAAGHKLFWLLLLFLAHYPGWAQTQNLHYAIHRNQEKVGELRFVQTKEGAKTTYAIESQVKVSMLLSFNVQAWEHSVYENNVLQTSSLLRKVNGKERTRKQIKNTGTGLVVTQKNASKTLKNYQVKYSTHCLYSTEPLAYTNVFSDNYQQFLSIQKVADHHYKVNFPDGGSNEYFYADGICKRIKLSSSLFDAEFVLVKP